MYMIYNHGNLSCFNLLDYLLSIVYIFVLPHCLSQLVTLSGQVVRVTYVGLRLVISFLKVPKLPSPGLTDNYC